MKTKDFLTIENALIRTMTGWAIHKRLMFIPELNHVLRGVYFEPSGFSSTSFYVTVFFLPLYLPQEVLSLNFGHRIKPTAEHGWKADMPNLVKTLNSSLQREALPFLAQVESLGGILDTLKSFSIENPHTLEAIAYTFTRTGNSALAIDALDKLIARLDLNVAWQREIHRRATMVRANLPGRASDVQKQLDEWRLESIKTLGLEEFQ